MPRRKKSETVAAEAAVKEVKAAETAEETPAPAKKTTRKTTARKAAVKVEEKAEVKAEPVAEVKAEPVAEVKAEAPAAKAEVFIEYNNAQVAVDEIIKNAKIMVGADKDIKVYVQPENSKAYIAFDDQSVEMDVYFVQ